MQVGVKQVWGHDSRAIYVDVTGEELPERELPDEVLQAIGDAAGEAAQRFVVLGTVCGHAPTRDHYCGVMVCPWYAGRRS